MDCTPLFTKAKKASRTMNILETDAINKILTEVADAAVENTKYILAENQKDLVLMGESDPRYDRLMLTAGRIEDIASDIRNVAKMQGPVGKVLMKNTRQNGLVISKISVPFGVIGVIYEARPNVTFDVFSLSLKSGNVCILADSRGVTSLGRKG